VNSRAYEVFREHKAEIEEKVEKPLKWVEDGSKRRVIGFEVDVGYRSEKDWEDTHEQIARGMDQLIRAVEPFKEEARSEVQVSL